MTTFFSWSRATAAALACWCAAAPAHAQDEAELPSTELTLPVLDLTLATQSLDGSEIVAQSETKVTVTLAADVLFAFNRASLDPRARSRLAEVAERLRRERPRTARVTGFTDAKGSSAYNRRLSARRARAVARGLGELLGGEGPRLVTRGRGEADPVAPNTERDGSDDPRGRARNRRVTVRF